MHKHPWKLIKNNQGISLRSLREIAVDQVRGIDTSIILRTFCCMAMQADDLQHIAQCSSHRLQPGANISLLQGSNSIGLSYRPTNFEPWSRGVDYIDLGGHPFMTSTKNHVFDPLPLSTCVHMGWTLPPPCGRPHTVDMKYTPLSWNG